MSATASASLSSSSAERQALRDLTTLALRTVEGAAAAGISVVRRDGKLETAAYTDERAVEIDRAQLRCHEGPCLVTVGAQSGPVVITIDDMAAESRWPRFAAAAQEAGVRSMISCTLPLVHGGTSVTLNVYGASAAAFDETAAKTVATCAEYSRTAFQQAFLISRLRAALESRQAIGEATGILMERYRVAAPKAFQSLTDSSQRLNVKVRLLAQHVVRTGQDPQTVGLDDLT